MLVRACWLLLLCTFVWTCHPHMMLLLLLVADFVACCHLWLVVVRYINVGKGVALAVVGCVTTLVLVVFCHQILPASHRRQNPAPILPCRVLAGPHHRCQVRARRQCLVLPHPAIVQAPIQAMPQCSATPLNHQILPASRRRHNPAPILLIES